MTESIIALGSLSLFMVAAGSGAPILYVHGNLASSRWFSRVMEIPGFRTVALDLPNFGRSSAMDGEPDLLAYAEVLARFIELEKMDRPIVVGHSLGGAVAQALAVRHPDRVRALVLVDSSAPDGLKSPPERYPLYEMMRANRAITSQALAPMAPGLNDPAFFEALLDDAMAMAPPAWVGHAKAFNNFDISAECANFKGPVLVIRGGKDILITEKMAADTAAAYPAGSLRIIAHAGHSPMVEDPALFRSIIAEFAASACEDEIELPHSDALRDAACMEE